jgi:hypothetical protein
MPSNSEIRTLFFAQGVDISLPSGVLNDEGEIDIPNNQNPAVTTGLSFDLATYREVIFDYGIRRRTDSTTGLIEGGRMRLTSNPDGVGAAKWILKWDNKNDEGVSPGVTFSKSVVGNVVDLMALTTNLAGANHHCYFTYSLTTFLV